MPSFNTEVPHQLGQQQATERLKQFVSNVRERYQEQVSKMEGAWEANKLLFSLTTYGFTIKGAMAVEEDRVRLDGQLPFAALAFRGKIEQTIADELRRELR